MSEAELALEKIYKLTCYPYKVENLYEIAEICKSVLLKNSETKKLENGIQ